MRATDGISKSLSYQIDLIKRKLKPQFLSLSGNEIRDLIKENGNDYLTEVIVENYLNYSGDIPVEEYPTFPTLLSKDELTFYQQVFLNKKR